MLRTMYFSKSTQNVIKKSFKIIWRLLVYHSLINFDKSGNILTGL